MSKTSPDKTTAELIARLEAAESGSRELSEAVLLAYGWTCQIGTISGYRIKWLRPDGTRPETIPAVTESLDAALTLVPEGWGWETGYELRPAPNGFAVISPKTGPIAIVSNHRPTPALALCIAALKARETDSHSPPAAPDSGARRT